MSKLNKLLFDGDAVIYRCAFAIEKEYLEHGPRIARWNLAYNIRNVIESICDKLDCHEYEVFLSTSSVNFRSNVLQYKANRKNARRPILYRVARAMLIKHYNTRIFDNIEADDALGFEQRDDTCIVYIDKDLRMIPGKHYNMGTHSKLTVKDPGTLQVKKLKKGKKVYATGFAQFCSQMIMGDACDNVKGIPRKGPIAAYNILQGSKSIGEYWERVVKAYKDAKQTEEYMYDNATLLWIQRNEGQFFKDWLEDNL